jgi:hypothetical protein
MNVGVQSTEKFVSQVTAREEKGNGTYVYVENSYYVRYGSSGSER